MGVLLVSASKIKSFTSINAGVDEALLLSGIQMASDIGLQNILGTKMYNHILDAAENSTLTGPETTLLQDYIQPYLIQRAHYEILPDIWARQQNKGIIIGNTEQGVGVSASDMRYMRSMIMDRYEFYAQRLMDYLKNNPNDFPIYYSWSSTDGMPPSKENYFSGIHITNQMPRRLAPSWIKGGYISPTDDQCCKDY